MYEIIPNKKNFMNHIVTDNHILTLKIRNHKSIKKDKNKLIIHSIYVIEKYRKNNLCKEFIKYILDKSNFNKIIIQSVLSKILYNFLLKFEHNGKKFILKKEGFVYKKL
jgi:hypothetical protein